MTNDTRTAYLIVKHSQRSEGGETNVVERAEFDTRLKNKDLDKATFILDLVTGSVALNRMVSMDPDLLSLHFQNKYLAETVEFLEQHGIDHPLLAETPAASDAA